jgi:CYTH domain-containing protein
MAIEIEYKFLVNEEKWNALSKPEPSLIVQTYIHKSKEVTVRVRIKGTSAFLTIKGKTTGVSRSEFEYEIPISDAEEMIEQFSTKHIRKYRYEIPMGKHIWEVDVFEGKLKGLTLAEIELDSEDEIFEKPDWVTKDVSLDASYYNAVLIEKC